MPYTPLEWKDGPEGGTPISAANLNRMEQGIKDAHDAVAAHAARTEETLIEMMSASAHGLGVDNVANGVDAIMSGGYITALPAGWIFKLWAVDWSLSPTWRPRIGAIGGVTLDFFWSGSSWTGSLRGTPGVPIATYQTETESLIAIYAQNQSGSTRSLDRLSAVHIKYTIEEA